MCPQQLWFKGGGIRVQVCPQQLWFKGGGLAPTYSTGYSKGRAAGESAAGRWGRGVKGVDAYLNAYYPAHQTEAITLHIAHYKLHIAHCTHPRLPPTPSTPHTMQTKPVCPGVPACPLCPHPLLPQASSQAHPPTFLHGPGTPTHLPAWPRHTHPPSCKSHTQTDLSLEPDTSTWGASCARATLRTAWW